MPQTSHSAHSHDRGPHHHKRGEHNHAPRHGHVHAPATFERAFAIGALLNILFVAGEGVFGVSSRSTALLADAGHNLGDVLGLLAAWSATTLARRRPSARYTYGLRSSSMLAALFNAALLMLVTGAVVAEAVQRLFQPQAPAGPIMMAVAAVGIVVNGATALLFASGRKGDLNVRSAFQHMLADALVAVGVVAAGGAIWLTGVSQIDPVASLVISAIVIVSTWGLLRDSLNMMLHAVPAGIEPEAVARFLHEQPGVEALHDLHIWSMSTTETALTAHLLMPAGHPGDEALGRISQGLSERFRIGHATLQIELDPEAACTLRHADAV